MEIPIVTREDIENAYSLSKNINQTRIDPHIIRAQRFDLRPILGSYLYNQFINGLQAATIESRWIDLLEGKEYLSQNNNTIYFYGCKPVVISYSFARIMLNNNSNVTRGGNTIKTTAESTPQTSKSDAYRITSAKQDGVQYAKGLTQFLDDNRNIYPEYGRGLDSNTGKKQSIGFFNASR